MLFSELGPFRIGPEEALCCVRRVWAVAMNASGWAVVYAVVAGGMVWLSVLCGATESAADSTGAGPIIVPKETTSALDDCGPWWEELRRGLHAEKYNAAGKLR